MMTVLLVCQFCIVQLGRARAAWAGHTMSVHSDITDVISTVVSLLLSVLLSRKPK